MWVCVGWSVARVLYTILLIICVSFFVLIICIDSIFYCSNEHFFVFFFCFVWFDEWRLHFWIGRKTKFIAFSPNNKKLMKFDGEKMSKNYLDKFKMRALNTSTKTTTMTTTATTAASIVAKPTYETILQRLNSISCAHVTLREPINKNKNNSTTNSNSNSNNNNNNNRVESIPNKHTTNGWRDGENAVCDTPTQELHVTAEQCVVYRNQRCLPQQSPPPINSTIESLVLPLTHSPIRYPHPLTAHSSQ